MLCAVETRGEDAHLKKYIQYAKNFSAEKKLYSRDSIVEKARIEAHVNEQDTFLYDLYRWYLAEKYIIDKEKARAYAVDLLDVVRRIKSPEKIFVGYYLSALTYYDAKKYDTSLIYCKKAEFFLRNFTNDTTKAEYYLLYGSDYENTNQIEDACQKYHLALEISDKLNYSVLIASIHDHFGSFFSKTRDFDKSQEYYSKAIRETSDSDEKMALHLRMAESMLSFHRYPQAFDQIKIAIGYSDPILKSTAFAVLRTYNLDNENIAEIANIYTTVYPGELVELERGNDLALLYKIKACVCESKSLMDSANYYYRKSMMQLPDEGSTYSSSNVRSSFYRCYGQFFTRWNRIDSAIFYFEMSYQLANKNNSIPYLILASKYLDSLYILKKDYKNAYIYRNAFCSCVKRENLNYGQDYLNLVEEASKNSIEATHLTKEAAFEANRIRFQYTLLMAAVIAGFVVLSFLGVRRVPKWIIKAVGYLTFIFSFEVISIFLEYQFEDITHHEPWKIVVQKFIVMIFLLPFQQRIERWTMQALYDTSWIISARNKIKEYAKNFFNFTGGNEV